MQEMSKANLRRKNDPRFENRFFVGRGLDVGCGDDPMKKDDWSKVTEIVGYDRVLGHRDASYLPEIKDEEFDFVVSSHCLEHLPITRGALLNWLRVIKPGGFIVAAVPEEFLYERGRFPSRFNSDHKVSFTMRAMPIIPGSQNILHVLWKLPVDVELVSLLTEGFDPAKLGEDQTMTGSAECAVEFVIRRPKQGQPW